MRQQIRDQAKAFVGRVGRRRQPEIDQRQLRGLLQLAQQLDSVRARLAGVDGKIVAEREAERVRDQRIVVDDQ